MMAHVSFRGHLKSARSLVTPYAEIRAGFVRLALERNRKATPFVEEARTLKIKAERASSPRDLHKMTDIQAGLLTAAGVSDKAAGHMEDADKSHAIKGLIDEYLLPAGSAFIEELVYRFLLTRGDTLGGSMRNVGGAIAQADFTKRLLAELSISGRAFSWRTTFSGKSCSDLALPSNGEAVKAVAWKTGKANRQLLFNVKMPQISKNIDVIVIEGNLDDDPQTLLANKASYIAVGELKGGIDPAGADEHWKTARSALTRVRRVFERRRPRLPLFFVGACIVDGMADEIWEQLNTDELANAANLTNSKQMCSICSWLCKL